MYKGMYWYGLAMNTLMIVMLIREPFVNYALFGILEYVMTVMFLALLAYSEHFVISRMLHLGETVSVDEAQIQYHHRGGEVVSIRWDEIAHLEYQEISCVLRIIAPNPERIIEVDNRMGKFGQLVVRVQDEMNKFAYKRRIRVVQK